MPERIIKWEGVDFDSHTTFEPEGGGRAPERDPRAAGGTVEVTGCHLMAAADMLEPATGVDMAYFDPDSGAGGYTLEELDEAVRNGTVSLQDIMTKTDRFAPLVNQRRARKKGADGDESLPRESDADLWHVPTSGYQAHPPTEVFAGLAHAVDNHDGVPNDAVHGEFRERRNGGEVFGEVVFDAMQVENTENDPVKLGLEFGWNYFGDRAFFTRGFAQQTACTNSIRSLTDREVVMHHNQNPDWREMWAERIGQIGVVGDTLSQAIMDARDLLFVFTGDEQPLTEDDAEDEGVIDVPFAVPEYYEHAGFPDEAATIATRHARETADSSPDDRASADRLNAWHLHAGATYWLSWHWDGSENSRAFRSYRRTANDMLFNPHQLQQRVRDEYAESVRSTIEEGLDRDDFDSDEAYAEAIDERVSDHGGIAQVTSATASLEDKLDSFRTTEERLDRMQEALAAPEQ